MIKNAIIRFLSHDSPDYSGESGPGWIFPMPPEMAQAMSVAEGSIMVIYPCKDIVEIEVIPPLSPEMQAHMDEILEDSKELFEELKRLGD